MYAITAGLKGGLKMSFSWLKVDLKVLKAGLMAD